MKTTTGCLIIFFFWSASLALETIYVGDYILPPSSYFPIQLRTRKYSLYDGVGQANYAVASFGPNGNGIQAKFSDENRKRTTGSLILKNNDGTYRSLDLPFNCSDFLGLVVATDGESFLCGRKIFYLGSDDSIQNLQELPSDISNCIFVNNSVLLEAYSQGPRIWSNLTADHNWTVASQADYSSSYPGQRLRLYPDMFATLAFPNVKLYQRMDLTWNLVEVAQVNYTNPNEPNLTPIVLWTGGDTIIIGWSADKVGIHTVKGEIRIFRKSNGVWSLNKTITSNDLGLAAPGGLGIGLLLLDKDTVIVHAVAGYNRSLTLGGGVAFALERINDNWVITTKFVQQNDEAYLVGAISYDDSGRLYFSACRTYTLEDGRRYQRQCGVKYAVWNRK